MPPSQQLAPKSWPSALPYLIRPFLSPSLSLEALAALGLSRASAPANVSLAIRIRPITNSSHPACGQRGLFAARALKPGTYLLDYLGYYHASSETDEASDYDLWLDRDLDVAVDASRAGNEARFLNDYRGVRRDGANAEFRVYRRGKNGEVLDEKEGRERGEKVGELRMGVWVVREIKKGEEVCVSYGKGFWNGRKGGGSQEEEGEGAREREEGEDDEGTGDKLSGDGQSKKGQSRNGIRKNGGRRTPKGKEVGSDGKNIAEKRPRPGS